jgi:hypothetical protein
MAHLKATISFAKKLVEQGILKSNINDLSQ